MAYSLSPWLKPRFFITGTNRPLAGGLMYTYLAGTTASAITYSDDVGTPNTNPIVLNSDGECNLYLDSEVSYRIILKNNAGVTQFDVDNVVSPNSESGAAAVSAAESAASAASALVSKQDASLSAASSADSAQSAASSYSGALASATESQQSASIANEKAASATISETNAAQSANQAEIASEVAASAGRVYETTALGIADTVDGEYFWIPKAAPDTDLYDLYKNASEVATYINSYPSSSALDFISDVANTGYTAATAILYEDETLMHVIVDANNVLRVMYLQNVEVGAVNYSATPNTTSNIKQQVALEDSETFDFEAWPEYVRVIKDVNDVLRVVEVYGSKYTGDTLFGGSASIEPVIETPVVSNYIVFLVGGQSNADGRGNYLQSPSVSENIGFWYKSATAELVDVNNSPCSNTASGTGSAWPSFALEFFNKTGFGVILVPCAVGGTGQTAAAAAETGVASWDTVGSLRGTAVSRFNAALSYLDANNYAYQIGGLLWCQGERDAEALGTGALASVATYETSFANMVTYFRAQISSKLPVFICQTGRPLTADAAGYAAIRAAQLGFVRSIENVFMCYTGAKNYVTRNYMSDEYHYIQAAYNEIGKHFANVALTKIGVN